MTDQGQGPPIVLIPGIQGRWEWMTPAVRALASRHRVLSFSLSEATGPLLFDEWVALVEHILDRAGEHAAAVVGVSFGGLVAAYYAAQRPSRVTNLVLVSSPSPRWQLDSRSAR
jgi:pimeloyl-ACP methyl ester carboxylesterase